jgi:hypothetical protein
MSSYKMRIKIGPIVKKIISLIIWYGLGVWTLELASKYIMPISSDIGTFCGWTLTISVILLVGDYFMDIIKLLEQKYHNY